MQRALRLFLIAAMLLPGPSWAQQVVGSVVSGGNAVPLVPPALAAPSLSGLSLGRQTLGQAPGLAASQLPSLSVPKLGAPSSNMSGGLRTGSPAAENAVPAAQAAALPSSAIQQTPKPTVSAQALPAATPQPMDKAMQGTRLRTQAGALDGQAEAGRAMPSLSHLGSEVQQPKPEASSADLQSQAEAAFAQKAALGELIPGSGGVEVSAAGDQGAGRSRRRAKKADEAPLRPTKYPSRDIRFNQKVFPSSVFRPDTPIEPLIVQAIDAARSSIVIATYEFKSKAILKALRAARKRGVKVQIVVDYTSAFPRQYETSDYRPSRSMELQSLINEGFDLLILRGMWRYGIMHNKFMVFDGRMAEFGSYNYTYTSENYHYENAKFTDDKKHIRAFLKYFDYLRAAAVRFEKAKAHSWPKQMPAPPADADLPLNFHGTRLPLWAFSPGGNPEKYIVDAINAAGKTLSVSMFTLGSTLISEALLAAKERGVDVRVILDKSQSENESMARFARWLAFHRIPVRLLAGPNPDGDFQLAEKDHNKFMVVDGELVETGSMNWTKNAALMSFENIHFSLDAVDAKAFAAFFEDMYAKAEPLPAPTAVEPLPTDAELVQELLQEPEAPPVILWPQLPQAPPVAFNGIELPAYVFRPNESIQAQLIKAIDASQKTIHLALYEFTLPDVMDALRRAKARGVEVRVILDYGHVYPSGLDHTGSPRVRSPEIATLIDEGFGVMVLDGLGSGGIMHNKFAVFDGKLVESGSFNWARTAEADHFENATFNAETGRVDFYLRYWAYMAGLAAKPSKALESQGQRRKVLPPPPTDDSARIRFHGTDLPRSMASPGGGIEAMLVAAIRAARTSIDFAMFSFYSQAVAEALLAARERGVAVRILLDANQAKLGKLAPWLAYNDMDVRLLTGPDPDGNVMFQKMHNKFMILDGQILENGSFNHTPNADLRNFETVNFLDLAEMVGGFTAYFQMMFEQGWKPRKPKDPPELKPAKSEAALAEA